MKQDAAGAMIVSAGDCMDIDDALRIQTAQLSQLPLLADARPEIVEDPKERDYKTVHYHSFSSFGLVWPPILTQGQGPGHIRFHGCTRRQAELLFLVDTLWPFSDGSERIEFLDLNPNSERILGPGCLNVDEKRCMKSPWRPHPMTLVGGTRLACRYLRSAGNPGHVVRL
eukprot:6164066-Karenia_brevis.AAC.1